MTQDAPSTVAVGFDSGELPLHKVCSSNTMCKGSDVMVSDFWPVAAGSCAVSTNARITIGGGYGAEIYETSAGCIPDGYAMSGVQTDGDYVVRRVDGDLS